MRRWLLWVPLAAFLVIALVVGVGLLRPADRTVRSAMVGKPLPDVRLPAIVPGKPGISAATFRSGEPRLINIFASWCIPCIAEAPQLMRLKAMGVPIEGVAIRDTSAALTAFLRQNGDPYASIGDDRQSAVQLALGSSGVPESFVVDGKGRIVLQHVGDIRASDVESIVAAVKGAR